MGKKRSGGKNTTPRKPVQIPTAWVNVARQLAGAKQQPLTWFLISLINDKAREQGIADIPLLPWQASDGLSDVRPSPKK